MNLNANILPFILRGITLKGITSANEIMFKRVEIWQKIAKFKDWQKLDNIITEISLEDIKEKADLMLAHKHQGRFLVKL